MEDRATSALKYAHVKYLNRNGQEIAISKKLNKLRDNSAFMSPFVRKRLSVELIEELFESTQKRNQLVRSLAKISYNHESLKEIAEQGQNLVRIFSNKVKSINRYHQKKFQSEITETTE